jgi:transcriptional regulator with XRE-family HTH domain
MTKGPGPSVFNQRLFMTRKARGLTLEELGKKTGLDQATISRLEREDMEPRASSVEKLADELEVSVDFLRGREDIEMNFSVALRHQALRRFLQDSSLDDLQKKDFELLCFRDSAPNSVRGWRDLAENYNFLHTHKSLS